MIANLAVLSKLVTSRGFGEYVSGKMVRLARLDTDGCILMFITA